jgi:hypothetical protein
MIKHLEKTKWFVPLKWEGSLAILVVRFLNNVFSAASLLTWFNVVWTYKKKEMRPWFVEIWVFLLCIILFLSLFLGRPGDTIIWWVGVYVLVDVIGAAIRDIVASPFHHRDDRGGYIKVYDKTRWLFMAVVNVAQVALCFALLALYYGDQFNPHITDPLSAIYFSVGYGDIVPTCTKTRALFCWELLIFLLIMVVKLPIAVSVMRIKEERVY